jgi:hypothetical protein
MITTCSRMIGLSVASIRLTRHRSENRGCGRSLSGKDRTPTHGYAATREAAMAAFAKSWRPQ